MWITTTEAEDGSITKKQAWGSKDEARAGVGDAANGDAMLAEVQTDKAGILAIFNGEPKILDVEKKFELKNGKWKTRVG